MKTIYGLSRNRDEKGNVTKRNLHDYVNCIHASIGGGYENMWVLVLELYEDSDVCDAGTGRNVG